MECATELSARGTVEENMERNTGFFLPLDFPYMTSNPLHFWVCAWMQSGSQGVLGLGSEKQDKGEKQERLRMGDAVRPRLCKARGRSSD